MIPEPMAPRDHDRRDYPRDREAETQREILSFQGKFRVLARNCDGKVMSMGIGSVKHYVKQIEKLLEGYNIMTSYSTKSMMWNL